MLLTRMLTSAVIATALAGANESAWGGAVATAKFSAPPSQSNQDDANTRAGLRRLFGPGKRVRDFAPFVTERGAPALLVLFVTGATEPPEKMDLDPEVSCPLEVAGIPLEGTYHVALVIDGKFINEVPIPGRQDPPESTNSVLGLPLRNTRFFNDIFWGQGKPIEYGDPGSKDAEPTRLIKLADFNGDGHAWEFRLIQDGDACGHKETLLAGYSARQHRAILYPILTGKDLAYWHDNFFPHPSVPEVPTVHYDLACGDHGNQVLHEQDFEYNAHLEAWVMTREDFNLCIGGYLGEDRNTRPTPTPADVQIHVGRARGLPGDTVTIPVTIDPRGADVSGVQVDMPFADRFLVTECTGTAGELLFTKFTVSAAAVRALLVGLDEGRRRDWLHFDPLPDGSPLYTCKVHISSDTVPGSYSISLGGLLVNSQGWLRLHATATDGEIVVLTPPTPDHDSQNH